MPEIKYDLEEGEPTCKGIECPDHPGRGHKKSCFYAEHGDPDECVPGIQQQRDEARKDTKRIDWIDQAMDCDLSGPGLHVSLVEIEDDETLREAIDRVRNKRP